MLSIVISIVTLIVIFWKVAPNSIVDLGSFIGVIAAFIGISVTLLIGYQIYNAMEIQHKLNKIDSLQNQLKQTHNSLEYLKSDTYDGIYEIAAKISYMHATEKCDAFYYMNISLKHALDLDEKRKDYIGRIDEIEKYALELNAGNGVFGGSNETKIRRVEEYMDLVAPIIKDIKQHPKYHIIEDRYDRLIQAYDARMNKIRQSKPVSITNIYEDLQ